MHRCAKINARASQPVSRPPPGADLSAKRQQVQDITGQSQVNRRLATRSTDSRYIRPVTYDSMSPRAAHPAWRSVSANTPVWDLHMPLTGGAHRNQRLGFARHSVCPFCSGRLEPDRPERRGRAASTCTRMYSLSQRHHLCALAKGGTWSRSWYAACISYQARIGLAPLCRGYPVEIEGDYSVWRIESRCYRHADILDESSPQGRN